MDIFQILSAADCGDIAPIVQFIKNGLYPVIQLGIPIILIVMGSIDLGKAVLSSDDKEIKGATGKLVKRAIAAVAVFFVAMIVNVIMGWLPASTGGAGNFGDCWSDPGSDTVQTPNS